MQTLDFLKAILPEDAGTWYFVATPSPTGKGFAHTACRSIAELDQRIGHLERESALNVYYACAGYREEYVDRPVLKNGVTKLKRQYRIKENVKLVKAYWLDLDVGVAEPGKAAKYPDQRSAIIAACFSRGWDS